MYIAQDCVPKVVLSDKDARFLSVNRKGVKKSEEQGDAERKREKVNKVNGHFVKFAEQEMTRITVRVLCRFRSLRLFCGLSTEISNRKYRCDFVGRYVHLQIIFNILKLSFKLNILIFYILYLYSYIFLIIYINLNTFFYSKYIL